MLATLGLTIGFGKSDNLASAYGIAVSATMLLTTALLFIAMREIWGWTVVLAGAVAGAFFVVDASFFPSSAAVNPALTIMANALRVGEHLIGRLK